MYNLYIQVWLSSYPNKHVTNRSKAADLFDVLFIALCTGWSAWGTPRIPECVVILKRVLTCPRNHSLKHIYGGEKLFCLNTFINISTAVSISVVSSVTCETSHCTWQQNIKPDNKAKRAKNMWNELVIFVNTCPGMSTGQVYEHTQTHTFLLVVFWSFSSSSFLSFSPSFGEPLSWS